MNNLYKSQLFHDLTGIDFSRNDHITILLGPRQVGKTTSVLDFLKIYTGPSCYHSADDSISLGINWVEQVWQDAIVKSKDCLLVIDEIQKITNWSEKIKKLWDAQKRNQNSNIRVLLLGSSSLQIQRGMSESLAGRFQLLRAWHWGLTESQALTNMNLETYLKFGGYPGSYSLIEEPKRWRQYLSNSIVDTVIGKDILNHSVVKSPALFRQTFSLLMSYPAQEISYTKLLGQLQDRGNTDLVKSYIELFEGAFLVKSIPKYSAKDHLKRASSPKILPLCPGLCFKDEKEDDLDWQGRVFEAAVGACLLKVRDEIFYWREKDKEVDFVLPMGKYLFAIEVKSGRKRSEKGLVQFQKSFKNVRAIFITRENYRDFSSNPEKYISDLSF